MCVDVIVVIFVVVVCVCELVICDLSGEIELGVVVMVVM